MPITPKQQPPYYESSTGIKTYIALLNQSSTNAPIATILQNTLGATPIWTRGDVGFYILTLADAFVNHKTAIILQNSAGNNTVLVAYTGTPNNEINLETYDLGSPADGRLSDTPIQIIVYP